MAVDGRQTFSLTLTTDASGDAKQTSDSLEGNWLDLLVIEEEDLASGAVLKLFDEETEAELVSKNNPAAGVFAVRYAKSGKDLSALSGQSTAFNCVRGIRVEVSSGGNAKSITLHLKHQDTHPDG